MKTLKQISCGKTVKVAKLHGEGPVKRRIMDMGSGSICEKSSAAGGSAGSDRTWI